MRQIQFEELYHRGWKERLQRAGLAIAVVSALAGLGKLIYDRREMSVKPEVINSYHYKDAESSSAMVCLEGYVTDVDGFGTKYPGAEKKCSFVLDNERLVRTPYDFNPDGNSYCRSSNDIDSIYGSLIKAMNTGERVKVMLVDERLESIVFTEKGNSFGN